MSDYKLFEKLLNARTRAPGGLNSPAFTMNKQGQWNLTPVTQDVLNVISSVPGAKDFSIEPMPSVAAREGKPLWGTGSGFYDPSVNKTYVDPLMGSTLTAAHEAGHAAFPTSLLQKAEAGKLNFTTNPQDLDRDSGRELTYAAQFTRPVMLEEANVQGVAYGAVDKIDPRLRADEYVMGRTHGPLEYPAGYSLGGSFDPVMKQYMSNKYGPPSPEEEQAYIESTKNAWPMLNRQFRKGYDLIMRPR
jgi:hypothetical protein